ncbi:Fms-interacting protein-domain-containing protein [Hyaloraphidium curvatum]|nr:Fms-interacting protein-domain-containing protein [Hyaloraphidium curvatum]
MALASDVSEIDDACSSLQSILQQQLAGAGESAVLGRLLNEALLLLQELKTLGRDAYIANRAGKLSAQEAKQSMDEVYLQLQNYRYEALHLTKEIAQCEEMETMFQEVPLLSEDVFRARAPPELLDGATTSHQLMLSRLRFEMHEREQLASKKEELTQKIKEVTERNQKRREDLDRVDEALEKFIQSAGGMQEMLGLPTGSGEGQQLSSQSFSLPGPLFVLLRMAEGYGAAFPGTIEVAVRPVAMEAAAKDEDRGRHGKEESGEEFYRRSNSCVVVTFRNPSSGASVTAKFHFLPKLNIIVCSTSSSIAVKGSFPSSTILHNLLEADDGSESPNPASLFLKLENGEPFIFSSSRARGFAYAWAQAVSGLDFGRPIGGAASGGEDGSTRAAPAPTFGAVVDRTLARLRAWDNVAAMLTRLDEGEFPVETSLQIAPAGAGAISDTVFTLKMTVGNKASLLPAALFKLSVPCDYPDRASTIELSPQPSDNTEEEDRDGLREQLKTIGRECNILDQAPGMLIDQLKLAVLRLEALYSIA